jgi:hypothetical protein
VTLEPRGILESPALGGVLSILAAELLTCQVLAYCVASSSWRELLEYVVPAYDTWKLVDPVGTFGRVNALLVIWLWMKWRATSPSAEPATRRTRFLCVLLAFVVGFTQWVVSAIEQRVVIRGVDSVFGTSQLIRLF